MSERRTGAFRPIAGLAATFGWVTLAASACGGDAFTTTTSGGDSSDASRPGVDAAPSDGAAGGALDAASRDGGLVDAGAGWCATQGTGHVFCEDFLHGVPDQLVEVALNGAIAADTADYASPPQSMTASAPALAKGASATAFASHDLAKVAGTQFTVSAYFNVAASCYLANGQSNGSTNPASILALNFSDSSYELVVAVLPTSVELVEVTSDADGGNMKVQLQTVQATGLVGSGWQNWTLDVDGSSLSKTATLIVGNATLFDKLALKGAPPLGLLQHPTAYFGLAAKNDGSSTAPACHVGVDDILIDARSVAISN